MTEYHPPLTGVQEKFEEELGNVNPGQEIPQQEPHSQAEAHETVEDQQTEEAMHLDQ